LQMDLQKKANIVRALSLLATTEAGSGHSTSCFSAADIATVLFDKYFNYNLKNPKYVNNDRFIISKGHVAPLYYSLFALTGAFPRKEVLTLRKFKSRLEGHPTPRFEFADAATGSLGQGLSIGAGIALHAKRENLPHKTFVLLGDGELAEGQNYEAANFASLHKLDNLIAIADINGLGQTGQTAYFHNTEHYKNIFDSLGFEVRVIDGHNFDEIDAALSVAKANINEKPFMIIAKTIKGKGVSTVSGREDFHGKAIPKDKVNEALAELEVDLSILETNDVLFKFKNPAIMQHSSNSNESRIDALYTVGEEHATREVFGDILAKIGLNTSIYALDGDVGNSTFTEKFGKTFPERFVQCYIAEQNMVGVANGLSIVGKKPFVATFGAFFTRAYDQIRMASIGKANIAFVGSHAGVSIGEDGPSQMALEDFAMFSPIPQSVILHPSDAISTMKLVPLLAQHKGISYLRTLRPKTKVLYEAHEDFPIGGSKVLKSSEKDVAVVVATGITVHEALAAYEILQKAGISIAVLDAYSIKPLDRDTILTLVKKTQKKIIITVEDHYINGGLGDIVAGQLSGYTVQKLAVFDIPFSGDAKSLLAHFKIDAKAIVDTVKSL
jgi:transketolase